MMKDDKPGLAIRINFSGSQQEDEELRKHSCKDCGYPFAQGGSLCEKCKKAVTDDLRGAAKVLEDFLSPRHVHSHRLGRLDPWTREGRNLIGDG